MYQVSNQFLEAVRSDSIETNLTGTIGSATFTKNNIAAGSFQLSNQSTETSDIVLGSVFMGQLTCTFTDVEIAYTNWIGKDITPTLSVKVGENSWESVPLGVFRVMEAKHTAEGVMVTAYDNMRKFDRRIKKAHFRNVEANLHTFVDLICTDCHVTFGMTQEEFFELPNATETTTIFGYSRDTKKFSNDIETYRDLLFYIAQAMGCFATMNRSGQLVFVKYKSSVVETISDRQRLSGAQFADYITNYTGIYVTNMRDESDSYYGYDYELIMAEIELVNQEILQIESDLVELQRQYDEHEITEEEYLAQKKVLETERKQCQKRLNWLNKAKDKAQAGEDGTYMDLGGNPFLQDDSSTVRERMRRRVLKALDPISYTPFTCDSVMGAHYDLGDVIYFTGGHAGSDGVFCCLMAFDWTYNAEYQMQGFGVDPSILNIKDRNAKAAKEANANAMGAYEISSGSDTPLDDTGKQDDIYIKYNEKTTYTPRYPISFGDAGGSWGQGGYVTEDAAQPTYHFSRPSDMYKVDEGDFSWDEDAGVYKLQAQGAVYSSIGATEGGMLANGWFGSIALKIGVPLERATYKISCDVKWSCPETAGRAYQVGFSSWINQTDAWVAVPVLQKSFETSYGSSELVHYEYEYEFNPGSAWISSGDPVYMWISAWFPYLPNPYKGVFSIGIANLIVEKVINPQTGETDTGKTATTDRYIDKVYVKDEDPQTLQEYWKEIEYVAGIDDSAHSGLELDYKRYLHLTPEVMRAWIKADPPQAAQTSNRFCVRYTGKPDTALSIAFWGNSGWLNKSIKRDSEGAYTLKSGGTVSSGVVEYCGYTITGLVAGERYYFNFKANFKDGTLFGDDYDKGLGIVLTTAGIISTDDFSGDPHTFDPDTGYCSFYRSTAARFYAFSFVAPASSIHMFVTVGDIVDGQTSSLTLSRFVISRNEKDYIRQFYIYDTESNDWLQYKPWGSDEEGEASSLSDLDDVNIGTVTNGQVLKYDSSIGAWVNADEGTGTEVEANPAGTATGELKKIAIDDDIYTIVDDDAVHTNDVGTAAAKDFTTSISSQNTNLPTSGAVKDAIDAAISSAYKPSGSKTVAELVSSLLVAANMGNVYNMSDSGETTSDFVEGAGKTINTGDNVGIVNIGTDANPVYKFDLLSGFIDMSDYYDKDEVDDLLDAKANNTPTFTEASERTNLAGSGETMTTILGKIKKFFSDLKTVAFSGSYNDLTNKPTLATVATSGSYNDLSNKPTIPTVNNGTLTIQKNGTNVQTFSANQSGNAIANITVPEVGETDTTNSTPYLYRASQNSGDRCYLRQLVGASFGVNQLVQNGKLSSISGWTTTGGTASLSNGTVTITASGGNVQFYQQITQKVAGHKVLVVFDCQCSESKNLNINWGDTLKTITAPTTKQRVAVIGQVGSGNDYFNLLVFSLSSGSTVKYSNIQLIDLTQMFGTSIADKAYTMEQATAGSGIAWLKSYGFFTESYYPYSTGSLQSVNTSGKVNVGKNLADLSQFAITYPTICSFVDGVLSATANSSLYSDGISVQLPQSTLYLSCEVRCGTATNLRVRIGYEDGTAEDITSGTNSTTWISRTATISASKKVTSIRFDWSNTGTFEVRNFQLGSTATTYEPYTTHTTPISTIDLRGVPTLVDNDIVYDGDVRDESGTLTRKYAEINLDNMASSIEFNSGYNSWVITVSIAPKSYGSDGIPKMMSSAGYTPTSYGSDKSNNKMGVDLWGHLFVGNNSSSTKPTGKIVYEVATPTTEQTTPIQNPEIYNSNGTEQFIDNRTVPIPVGHNSEYVNLPDWMETGYVDDLRHRVDEVIPSEIASLPRVYAKSGEYTSAIQGWADVTNLSLTLDKGTYYISVYAYYTPSNLKSGTTSKRGGCAICDSSGSRLTCSDFEENTPNDLIYYGFTFSTQLIETITADGTVRKMQVYGANQNESSPVKCGIMAIKVS